MKGEICVEERKTNWFYIVLGLILLILPFYFIYLKYHSSFNQEVACNYYSLYEATPKDVKIELLKDKKRLIAKVETNSNLDMAGIYLDSVIGSVISNFLTDKKMEISGIERIVVSVKIYPENRKFLDKLIDSRIEKISEVAVNEKDNVRVEISRIGNTGTIIIGEEQKQIPYNNVVVGEAVRLFHKLAMPEHCWVRYNRYEKTFVLFSP